jgi:hypothetical protein
VCEFKYRKAVTNCGKEQARRSIHTKRTLPTETTVGRVRAVLI